jgi:hypothetical protein
MRRHSVLVLVSVLLGLCAAAAAAERGIFPGRRPLVRVTWRAVLAGADLLESPTEVTVLSNGEVIWHESYDGAAFLLQLTPSSPANFALLRSELGLRRIGTLTQTCRLPFVIAGPRLDRQPVPGFGEPIRLVWYAANGARTAEIVLDSAPGLAECPQPAISSLAAVFNYLMIVGEIPPRFVTGFLPRGAGGERQVSGVVHCGAAAGGIAARLQLFAGQPVDCVPEICFPRGLAPLVETTSDAAGRFTLSFPAAAGGDLWVLAEPLAPCDLEFGQVRVPAPPIDRIDVRIDTLYDPPG